MQYIQEVLEKFRSLPKPIQEAVGGIEVLQKVRQLEQKHKIDLGFLVILAAVGELPMDDIEEYLQKKYNMAAESAREIHRALQTDVFRPAWRKLGVNVPADAVQALTLPGEQNAYIQIFKENLIAYLQAELKIQQALNTRIFYIFTKEDAETFQKNLAQALLSNTQKLTGKYFVLSGKPVRPTIASWLKDFIKQYGAELPDNIKITRYLTEADNVKPLDAQEKEMVRKFLNLYRNLVFFPDSMPKDLERWQILPLQLEKGSKVQSYKEKMQTTAKPSPAAEPGSDRKFEELSALLEQYSPDSLERRALEEEILKIQRKK